MGRPLGTNGELIPIPRSGFFGEEIERIETPLNPNNPNKKIKIKFSNFYDLIKYCLQQQINLDTALDPQSYKPPKGKLQNPEYERDSEKSLLTNEQPDTDKKGKKRELVIGKDVHINSFLVEQQYSFQVVRRLEYLFPAGEMADSEIDKSLLIPGQKGNIKIHNLIHFLEVLTQYINATLGNPREEITVRDVNPAIPGDQGDTVKALSISELLRELMKFQMDTAGDVDALQGISLRNFRTSLANRVDLIQIGEQVEALFEDSGMLEEQQYIKVHLEGDPYAGQWKEGKGFEPNPKLDENTEEATEEVLSKTAKNFTMKVKVSRRSPKEKTDMRDLVRGLAEFVQRLFSVPVGGETGEAVGKLIENAKFKVKTDLALIRGSLEQAATASRNRTRKRKKG